MKPKNILITGGAKRLGAGMARLLHAQGHQLIIHYRHSQQQAQALVAELNQQRPDSAIAISADLLIADERQQLIEQAINHWQGIDVLINNASSFYPTPLSALNERQWDELMGSNLKAPFFLTMALSETLAKNDGCIVNIVDIHAERGLKNHSIYSIAKAGLGAMTKILAKELAPNIRVNGIAPGAILWPEQSLNETDKQEILSRIALQRCGEITDIAKAVRFLIEDANYSSGEIIKVDGGRTLFC